jgi:hypothetical protein
MRQLSPAALDFGQGIVLVHSVGYSDGFQAEENVF